MSFMVGVYASLIMSVSDFGAFTLFVTVFVFVSQIAEASNTTYVSFVNRESKHEKENDWLTINLLWKIGYLLCVIALSFLVFILNYEIKFVDEVVLYAYVAGAIAGAVFAIHRWMQAFYLAKSNYLHLTILKPIYYFVVFLVFLWVGVVYGKITSAEVYLYFVVTAVVFAGFSIRWLWGFIGIHNISKSKPGEFIKHSLGLAAYSVISGITARADVLIISVLLDMEQLGIYGVALRIAGVVGMVIPVISTFMMPKAGMALRGGQYYYAYRKTALMLVSASMLCSGALIFFVGSIIITVFGEQYNSASSIAVVLIISLMVSTLGMPIQLLLQAHNDHVPLHVVSVVRMLIGLPVSYVLVSLYDLRGAAVAYLLVNATVLFMLMYYGARTIREFPKKA